MTATGTSAKYAEMLSKTSLDMLPNKIDSSSVLKDGKTQAIYGLLKQQQTFCSLENLICTAATRGEVLQASGCSGISEW